jgi:hypothetical protein
VPASARAPSISHDCGCYVSIRARNSDVRAGRTQVRAGRTQVRAGRTQVRARNLCIGARHGIVRALKPPVCASINLFALEGSGKITAWGLQVRARLPCIVSLALGLGLATVHTVAC